MPFQLGMGAGQWVDRGDWGVGKKDIDSDTAEKASPRMLCVNPMR